MTVDNMPSVSGFEFWGATISPGKIAKCIVEGNILHLTSIALDEVIGNGPQERSVLSVIIDGKQFVLASLREGVAEQITVDFLFRENKEFKFKLSGKTPVHLVGYLQPLDMEMDDDDSQDEDFTGEDEEIDSDGESMNSDDEMLGEEETDSEDEEGSSDEEEIEEEQVQERVQKRTAETPIPAAANNKKAKVEQAKKVKVEQPKKVLVEEPIKVVEQPKKVEQLSKKEQKKAEKPAEVQKTAEPKADAIPEFQKLFGGVMIKDTYVGEGKVAAKGKRLGVLYKGMLKSGKVFDSNCDGDKPFHFRLGNGDVIKAWDVAFQGMKVGGKRTIVCPPKMAYGSAGSPPVIPPNSVLIFEVTLVHVK